VTWQPTPQTVVAVDIVSSGGLDDHLLLGARKDLRGLLADTLAQQDINLDALVQTDLGDGLRFEVPGVVTPAALLHPFVANLDTALRLHARRASAEARLRLRMAIHHGLVHRDEGSAGNTMRVVARLLDAQLVRRAARLAPGANLVVVASQQLYDDVIRHGYSIAPDRFQRIALAEKEMAGHAWLYVPDHTPGLPLDGDGPPNVGPPADAGPDDAPPGDGPRHAGPPRDISPDAGPPPAGPATGGGERDPSADKGSPDRSARLHIDNLTQQATTIITAVGDGSTFHM
jgi:hypothetical protein